MKLPFSHAIRFVPSADRLVKWTETFEQAGCDPVSDGRRVCFLRYGGISAAAGRAGPVEAQASSQALYRYDRDCPAGRLQRRAMDTGKAGIDLATRLSPAAHADSGCLGRLDGPDRQHRDGIPGGGRRTAGSEEHTSEL